MRNSMYLWPLLAAVVFSSVFFTSCKKGENDPGLSFRSRDARLVGEWQLKSVSSTATYNVFTSSAVSSTTIVTDTYDGTLWVDAVDGVTNNSDSYSLSLNIEKTGKISCVEVDNGRTREGTSDWYWLDSKKNKTEVYVGLTNTKHFDRGIYNLDRLSNKEIVFTYSFYDKDIDAGNGDETIIEETWTFEAI